MMGYFAEVVAKRGVDFQLLQQYPASRRLTIGGAIILPRPMV